MPMVNGTSLKWGRTKGEFALKKKKTSLCRQKKPTGTTSALAFFVTELSEIFLLADRNQGIDVATSKGSLLFFFICVHSPKQLMTIVSITKGGWQEYDLRCYSNQSELFLLLGRPWTGQWVCVNTKEERVSQRKRMMYRADTKAENPLDMHIHCQTLEVMNILTYTTERRSLKILNKLFHNYLD